MKTEAHGGGGAHLAPPSVLATGDSMSSSQDFYPSTMELAEAGDCQEGEEGNSQKHETSDIGALLHVVKSSLGTGVLASAEGFKNAGIVVGFVGTFLVGLLCTHCTYIMVKCSQEMCSQLKRSFMGYSETVDASMRHCANGKFSKYANAVRLSIEGFMFFTYYGVNTVYIILIAESFKSILEDNADIRWNIRVYIVILILPIYLVGMVKNMKYLVPFSAMANILLFVGLIFTFRFTLVDLPPVSDRPYAASIFTLPLFFATVLFGMEGIGTMLPIENSMKNQNHFLGCPGVLTIAMTVVVSMFCLVGFFGYLKYGDAVHASITLNLGENILGELVKGLIAGATLFSYGLQLTASMDVVWRGIENRFSKEKKKVAYKVTRALMIAGTFVLAVAVPNLGPVISLIGAVGFSMLGFFYPAICESIIYYNNWGKFNWLLWKNVGLVVITFVALISGSVASIIEIIHTYK